MKNKKNIIGVKIYKKKVISDKRGKILHMLRKDDKHFSKFGEIYFLCFWKSGVIWHIHKKNDFKLMLLLLVKLNLFFLTIEKKVKLWCIPKIILSNKKSLFSFYSTKYLERFSISKWKTSSFS